MHEGETSSTSLGYTSVEDTSSSDDEDWEVGYFACFKVEEEGLDDVAEKDWQLTMGLGRSEISHTEGIVDLSDCQKHQWWSSAPEDAKGLQPCSWYKIRNCMKISSAL